MFPIRNSFDQKIILFFFISGKDKPVPDIILQWALLIFMFQHQIRDQTGIVNLSAYSFNSFLICMCSMKSFHLQSVIMRICKIFTKPFHKKFQRIDSIRSRTKIMFHYICKIMIFFPTDFLRLMWIKILYSIRSGKINTAFTSCYCTASSITHRYIWKQILIASIGFFYKKVFQFIFI